MNKLRIENKDVYRIEVNDEGECIEFDLSDISLQSKCFKAVSMIEEIQNQKQKKLNALEKEFKERKKKGEKLNFKDFKPYNDLEVEMFEEMREAMDIFLGEGACQKIFGDRNYYEMFNDLMNELSRPRKELKGKSHLDMLNMKTENIHKRIMEKYAKSKKVVI